MTDPTPPDVSDALREAVARHINPSAYDYREEPGGYVRQCWDEAIAEADALLAGPIASEIARLTGERDAARDTNRELHRRLQAVEGPLQSRVAHLSQGVEFWMKQRKRQGARAVSAIRRAEAAEAETAVLTAECKVYRGLAEKYASAAEAAEAEAARLRAALEDAADALGWAASALRGDENDAAAGVTLSAANNARAALPSQEKTDV